MYSEIPSRRRRTIQQRSNASLVERLEDRTLFAAAPHLTGHAQPMAPTEGAAPVSWEVATFTDSTSDSTGNYSAMINWGDGTTTSGNVVPGSAGGFIVSGTHGWTTAGVKHVTVQITDSDGSKVKVIDLARVADAPVTASGTSITVGKNTSFTDVVATFVDADPNAVAGVHPTESALINWGDGAISAGTITLDSSTGVFSVTGKHTYLVAKTFTISTTVHDKGGSHSTATSSAMVLPPQPTTSPSLIGDYKGTIKLGGDLSLVGSQSFELDITGQTLTSLTISLTVAGIQVVDNSMFSTNGVKAVGLLTNGNFAFEYTATNADILLEGHVSPTGSNIAGFVTGTGSAISPNFHGDYSLTLQ